MRNYSNLSLHEQELLRRESERIMSKFGFINELLSVTELARMLGKPVKSVRNLKSRNAMPGIPPLKIGEHQFFWIMHVIMWMSGIGTQEKPTCVPSPNQDVDPEPSKLGRMLPDDIADDVAEEGCGAALRQRKRKTNSVAKEAILRRGLAILAEEQHRRAERDKGLKSPNGGDQ